MLKQKKPQLLKDSLHLGQIHVVNEWKETWNRMKSWQKFVLHCTSRSFNDIGSEVGSYCKHALKLDFKD